MPSTLDRIRRGAGYARPAALLLLLFGCAAPPPPLEQPTNRPAPNHLGEAGSPPIYFEKIVLGIVTSKTFDHDMEGVTFGLPIGDARERLSIEWR